MNTEQEMNSADELSKENVAIVLGGLLDKLFSATLVAPALSQVGLTIGDQVKFFRIRNLMKLNESLERVIEKRSLDRSNLKKLSLSVGFPLLEKASYQDDEFLREKWANLLASAMDNRNDEDTGFSLDITYIEILHQFSRLDCEVLEYIVENGVSGRDKVGGHLQIVALNPLTLRNVFPDKLVHISLEKLVTLGCVYRVLRTPLSTKGENDGYGPLAQDVMVTMVGLNLYVSASGRQPKWHNVYIEDEEVDDKTEVGPEQ